MFSVDCLGAVYSGSDPNYFELSLLSLLDADFQPNKIIVVIDGPIPPSLELLIAKFISHPLLFFPRLASNSGLGEALRYGVQFCHSNYICRFDTDDICHPLRLSLTRDFLESYPSVDIVGSSVLEFSTSSSDYVPCRVKHVPLKHSSISFWLNFRNSFNHPTVVIKRSVFDRLYNYSSMPFFEDYYFWISLRSAGFVFANIDLPLVAMRRESILSRRIGLSYLRSEFCFFKRLFCEGRLTFLLLIGYFARFIVRIQPLPVLSPIMMIWRDEDHLIPNPDLFFYPLTSSDLFLARRF